MNDSLTEDVTRAIEDFRKAMEVTEATLQEIESGTFSNDKARILIRIESESLRAAMWRITGVTLD